jgi:hypothetical protein
MDVSEIAWHTMILLTTFDTVRTAPTPAGGEPTVAWWRPDVLSARRRTSRSIRPHLRRGGSPASSAGEDPSVPTLSKRQWVASARTCN